MKEKVLVLDLAGEGRWKLCAWREAWEAPLSSSFPSPPGVSWSFILTSSLLERTWEEVSRRLARGWEICWMRQDQESRGCPAQGGGGGWERAKVSQVRTAKQCCHQLSSGTHLCPGSPWKLPSRLTSQPAAELHSGAGEMEVKAEPWSLWLRCDRARDTPRDGVEQPSISSGGDMVHGKDVTFSPCCPLAVLVTGISPLGSPSTREGLWNTDPLPARNHLVLLVAPRTSFEE